MLLPYHVVAATGVCLQVLTLRKETLEYKLTTLMGKYGISVSILLRRPCLLGYSIEKRIIPRVNIMLEANRQHTLLQQIQQHITEQEEIHRTARIRTDGSRRIRRITKNKVRTHRLDDGLAFNVNALYLSQARFEKYLETSARERNKSL